MLGLALRRLPYLVQNIVPQHKDVREFSRKSNRCAFPPLGEASRNSHFLFHIVAFFDKFGASHHVILTHSRYQGVSMPRTIHGVVLYDTKEVAQEVDREPRTIQRWIREGKLKAAKHGSEYLISKTELEEFMKNLLQPSSSSGTN